MATIKEKLVNYYEDFCNYMQQDTRGAEMGIYAASGLLFAYACRRVRPITKFGRGKDIPMRFIRDNVPQYGRIESVDPSAASGPLLMVNHRPPLNFLIPFNKRLPIKLPGIAINTNGFAWLQTVAVGREIKFIPISQNGEDNSAICRVLLVCPENKRGLIDASEVLLSLGFAKTVNIQPTIKDLEWEKYYSNLLKIESTAKNQRRGLWSTSLPPKPWPIRFSRDKLKSIVLSMLPANRRLPELVR